MPELTTLAPKTTRSKRRTRRPADAVHCRQTCRPQRPTLEARGKSALRHYGQILYGEFGGEGWRCKIISVPQPNAVRIHFLRAVDERGIPYEDAYVSLTEASTWRRF